MEHQISNEYITLTVSAKGAEMRSIEKDSVEYLWNGDEWRSGLLGGQSAAALSLCWSFYERKIYAKWEGICYGNTWICQWTSLPG